MRSIAIVKIFFIFWCLDELLERGKTPVILNITANKYIFSKPPKSII
jgi:hypothetical protein